MVLFHLFLSIIFLITNPSRVFAQGIENYTEDYTRHFKKEVYFDFFIEDSWLMSYDSTKELNFHHKIPDEYLDRFIVKPFSSRGQLYIFDSLAYTKSDFADFSTKEDGDGFDFWISENSMWSDFPSLDQLEQKILIKLEGNFHDTSVWFEVLDKKTGKIYKTPKHTFWNYSLLEKNFETLNNNILSNAKISL